MLSKPNGYSVSTVRGIQPEISNIQEFILTFPDHPPENREFFNTIRQHITAIEFYLDFTNWVSLIMKNISVSLYMRSIVASRPN